MSNYNTPTLKLFDNGMVLVNVANRLLNTSTLGFVVGSRHDPLDLSGAAHFTEHLVTFRGKEVSGRQINRMARRYLGGSNGVGMNVVTMHSHTGYGHQDLLRRKYLQVVFGTFARTVRDGMYELHRVRGGDEAVIDPEIFDLEKAAVGNETAENDDVMFMAVYKAALKLLYTTNPARHFGDSDLEQLKKVKLGTLKNWARGWYVPANMRVILLGPTQDEAVRMVREAGLDQIPSWESATWDYDHSDDMPKLEGIRSQIIDWPGIKMHHVMLMWPVPTYDSHRHRVALEVLAAVLKDRIEEELRNNNRKFEGGVYHPAVELDTTDSSGYIQVWFATRGDSSHTEQLIERVHGVIDRLKDDHSVLLTEDVDDCRRNLADDFLEAYRYVPAVLADRLLMALANGDTQLKHFQKYHADVLRISPRRIRNVAHRYLHCGRHVQVIVRPV